MYSVQNLWEGHLMMSHQLLYILLALMTVVVFGITLRMHQTGRKRGEERFQFKLSAARAEKARENTPYAKC
jgi:hypothetical protein